MEEHFVILEELGSNYVDHLIPMSGKVKYVVIELITYIRVSKFPESIRALGCGGCPKE